MLGVVERGDRWGVGWQWGGGLRGVKGTDGKTGIE